MARKWLKESPSYWDDEKQRIVGGAPRGAFDLPERQNGELLPGEWWRVEEEEGAIVGYGWMDITWGDAEILLAVSPDHQEQGIGTYILDHLEREAAGMGIHYLYNVVRPSHPHEYEVSRWLESRRFQEAEDGALRRSVQRK